MPHEKRSGKMIGPKKPGNLHFHCDLGSCYDSLIQEQMNSYVPKHKSWLKEKDLRYVIKLTKEEEDAAIMKEKRKSGFDIMFEQVQNQQRQVEREEKQLTHKVDCRRKNNPADSPIKEHVIKAAQLFQTAEEENAVNKLMKEAEKSEIMRKIAEKASQETIANIKRQYSMLPNDISLRRDISEDFINEDSSSQNPLDWIEVDDHLQRSPVWQGSSVNLIVDEPARRHSKAKKTKGRKSKSPSPSRKHESPPSSAYGFQDQRPSQQRNSPLRQSMVDKMP